MAHETVATHTYENTESHITIEKVVNSYYGVPKDKVLFVVCYWAHEVDYQDDKLVDGFVAINSERFETLEEAQAAFNIRKVNREVGASISGLPTYTRSMHPVA